MAVDLIAKGRAAYRRQQWTDACTWFSAADSRELVEAPDLEGWGTAAHLTGRDEIAAAVWQRAYQGLLAGGRSTEAARCAFWFALVLLQRGEHARGGGWLARAGSALEESGRDCAEQGYVRLPGALQLLGSGDPSGAHAEFVQILAIAERFEDPDLRALGRLGCGQALIAGDEVARGIALLDDAMVAATGGELSTIAAGFVYCAVIIACQQVFDLERAQEWTGALNRWCEAQQDLTPYRGQCWVHRSQLLQLRGDWTGALAEAERACEHLAEPPPGDPVLGMALYQRAELLRVRGDLTQAEIAYRGANHSGHPIQPGLALLRLAQGRLEDASAAMHRLLGESMGTIERSRVLAACVEISLAGREVDVARAAADELETLAEAFGSTYLAAVVASARGAVLLADGEPAASCAVLREARAGWQGLAAPFEEAQARVRMAQAYRQLGDHDTAEIELDAARVVFEELGALPALAQVRELRATPRVEESGLTPRELEVLRLLATGVTNRQIGVELVISQKTVARHVANLFTKLDVTSRAAATAYAYEHDLVERG